MPFSLPVNAFVVVDGGETQFVLVLDWAFSTWPKHINGIKREVVVVFRQHGVVYFDYYERVVRVFAHCVNQFCFRHD